jgi:cytochrome o ubiquinol oxidase operon protein cyoD
MSKQPTAVVSKHTSEIGSSRSYVTGFVASICLTTLAYSVVRYHATSSMGLLIGLIVGLALIQFIVQLLFFLHLGTEMHPRWKLLVFGFMVVVVSILVGGSLWIMSNLNAHMMLTPAEQTRYMNDQDGL